jgi:transposase
MATFAKVRRMYFRDRLSISEIARRTSLTRNTIKKWLKAPSGVEPHYARKPAETKLTPFEPSLLKALQTDAHRPKRDRRTAQVLFQELQQAGFTGAYSRVTAFIRKWRAETASPSTKSAFVPLKFALGEAFQFDWSEESLLIGGIHRKIMLAHLKLCASRAFALAAYPGQSHEMLFDAHTRAFQMLGGVPNRGIYDNMKTAVDKVLPGKDRVVNARFHAMTAHYLFEPDFCNVASGWEKGVVEKNVQDRRRQLWQEAKRQQFASFGELNDWLEQRCRAAWQVMVHPDYPELTLAELLQDEQLQMMPFPGAFDGYIEVLARVSSTCLVTFQRNRYSVPCHLANQMVSLRLYPERLVIYAEQEAVANHVRSFDRSRTFYDWLHYLPLVEKKPGVLRNGAPFDEMPTPLRQLQQALLRRSGGDRVMAKVLGYIPSHGLDAVRLAIDVALESGAINAEHVLNVLARLQAPPKPEALDTPLQVAEPPLADSSRYDQLLRNVGA